MVYEGGKGDPASLYKSGRNNRRPPSMGNFPDRPIAWDWADGHPKTLALEVNGTLTNEADPNRLTEQGKTLLHKFEEMGVPVQFLNNGRPIAPPASVTAKFSQLKTLGVDSKPDIAMGNWGREFRGVSRTSPSHHIPHIETVKIGAYRDEGILSEDLLDKDYFLNRLAEMGVLKPKFHRSNPGSRSVGDSSFAASLDLREVAPPKALPGSHNLARIFQIEDPKARVAALSKISWEELTSAEQELMLERASGLNNSFEIGQFVRIAGASVDSRWKPILSRWLEEWKGVARGWQTFVRGDAENALNTIKSGTKPQTPSVHPVPAKLPSENGSSE